MVFTTEQLKGFAHGCIGFEEKDGSISFLRLTKKQINVFQSVGESRLDRALCSAGVSLAFETDAAAIQFFYTHRHAIAWDHFSFDLYVDGVFDQSRHGAFSKQPEGEISFSLDGKPHRIDLYFPQYAQIFLHDFSVTNGAFVRPAQSANKKILFVGDSITQGFDVAHASFAFPHVVARRLGVEILNQGVGGHVHDSRVVDPTDRFSPDLIVVAFGANDYKKEQLEENIENFYRTLFAAYPNIPVAAVTPIWSTAREDMGEGRKRIANVLSRFEMLHVIDGSRLVARLPEFFADGLHPTEMNMLLYGVHLSDALAKILK